MMDENLKRAIIIDHYTKAHNRGLVEDERYNSKHMASSSCIDDITVQMLIDGNAIKDVRFDGRGCAISTSSTSILSDLIKGKSKSEALDIINRYESMLKDGKGGEELLEAEAFDTLYKQPNRIKCGLIGVDAMKQMIEESDKENGK